MKVVVALDSFKGSLTAMEASHLVASRLRDIRPGWQVLSCPMADGGEGTASVLVAARNGAWHKVDRITGPLPGMKLTAGYGWLPVSRTAVVEMAAASGLALLSRGQRNPLRTTSFGTGQLIAEAARQGARRILLTLGGSATVDGGTGAAAALGWRFLDCRGRDLPPGGGFLGRIRRFVPPILELPEIEVLCDVENTLCGTNGAARVFAPQKGATPWMVLELEQGLRHLAGLIRRQLGIETLQIRGGGAAGGFGAGAVSFFGARLVSGVQTVMKAIALDEALSGADWVITGEGCFDEQSFQGKVVSGVRDLAVRKGVKVAVLAGRVKVTPERWQEEGISLVKASAGAALDEGSALANAESLLADAVHHLTADLT